MTHNVIQAEYDDLERIAGRFQQESASTKRLMGSVERLVEDLQRGGWEGEGAVAFFREMNGEVLPAVNRLVLALEEGNEATRQIVVILQQAEEDAANPFNALNLLLQMGSGWGGSLYDFVKDALKAGGGLGEILDFVKSSRLSGLSHLGTIAGLLEILENPDGDWAKSIGSGLIEEIGIDLIPYGALVMGANDIHQFVKKLESGLVSVYTDLVSTNPAMESDLMAINDRYYQNVQRTDLNNLTGPIADLVYDFSIAPMMDASQDFMRDPSLYNFSRWANTLNPTGQMIHALTDSDVRRAVGGDVLELFGAGGNFLLGAADMRASRIDQMAALTVATFSRSNDFLPDGLERSIDQGASRFIDQIANGGLMRGVNIPGIPFI